MNSKAEKYKLKSVDTTLDLIEVLLSADDEMGVTEISKAMSIGKSTAYRILTTLQDRGYVEQNLLNDKYKLGYKFVSMANDLLQKLDVITVTRDEIEGLVEKVNTTAFLATYSNMNITIIERYPCKNERTINYYAGTCLPAYSSACGKAILSSLDKQTVERYYQSVNIEDRTPYTVKSIEELKSNILEGESAGYFQNQQESDEGIVAFAVPIFGRKKSIIGAVALCGPASKMNENKDLIIDYLIEAGHNCSKICKDLSNI